jgi:hypothetical protein
MSTMDQLLAGLRRALGLDRDGSRPSGGPGTRPGPTPPRPTPAPAPAPSRTGAGTAYPGDFRGMPSLDYRPRPDGRPDPGEVVWTWVPFQENPSQGKDRPVLLVGRDGPWLLAVPLTSKDHDRDAAQERAAGREWVDVGSGSWDRAGRPSEARVDRIIRVDPADVRREGAVLDRARFDEVAAGIRAHRTA